MSAARSRQFLVFGRSGMGKSSLINSVFGRYIAHTAEFEACTRLVTHHAHGTPWGDLTLVDTPGFAEGGPKEDRRVVDLIASHVDVARLTAVLMVTRLDDTRLRPEEVRMIRLVTRHFGEAFWIKSWLMMTRAATLSSARRGEQSMMRRRDLRSAVRDQIVEHQGYCSFTDFHDAWLVDNIVPDWSTDCVPLSRVLSTAA